MSNPTPNQPLNQHPHQAQAKAEVLGSDKLFFVPGSIAAGDTLIIPGPPKGVVRRANSSALPSAGGFYNPPVVDGGAVLNPGVSYVLKKKNGTEALLQAVVSVAVNTPFAYLLPVFFLTDEDVGIFLRLDVSTSGAPAVLTGHSQWDDTRNIDVTNTVMPLTENTLVTVLDNPVEDNVIKVLAGLEGQPAGIALLFLNHDSAAHDVSVFLSNGATDIPLATVAVPVASLAGDASVILNSSVVLLPGWSIKVSMTTDATVAPSVYAPSYKTNYAPVRQDQGGAY